jgi:hypothetical protein
MNEKLNSVTADQLHLREIEGGYAAFIQRVANDIQIFLREATADVKNEALFSRTSIDPARH